jgi:hypothetical protein
MLFLRLLGYQTKTEVSYANPSPIRFSFAKCGNLYFSDWVCDWTNPAKSSI